MRCAQLWTVGCLMWVLGCAARGPLPLDGGIDVSDEMPGLTVQWSGVGAFWLHYDGVAVLTDPFWSNYSLGRVLTGTLPPDPDQIEPWLPPLGNVQAVLVGQAVCKRFLICQRDGPAVAPEALLGGGPGGQSPPACAARGGCV